MYCISLLYWLHFLNLYSYDCIVQHYSNISFHWKLLLFIFFFRLTFYSLHCLSSVAHEWWNLPYYVKTAGCTFSPLWQRMQIAATFKWKSEYNRHDWHIGERVKDICRLCTLTCQSVSSWSCQEESNGFRKYIYQLLHNLICYLNNFAPMDVLTAWLDN